MEHIELWRGKKMKVPTKLILILALIGMVVMPGISYAGSSSKAKAIEIKGDVRYMKLGATSWEALDTTVILEENDSIRTGPDSEVKLVLMGSAKTAEITIGSEADFKFDTFRHDEATKTENTILNIGVGRVLVKAEKLVGESKFQVKTPTSIVGIRGTVFEVNVPKPQ